MEENRPKITWRRLLPELLGILVTAAGIWGICLWNHMPYDRILSRIVLGVAGTAVLGFHLRQVYLEEELDYDNGEHYLRFWICFLICLAGAFVCAFLPAEGWPFLPVFVMLALFSNMSTGILAASVLLVISMLLCEGKMEIFPVYFLSGLFAVTLFRHLEDNFKVAVRLFLSMICLLLCETAGMILPANARPDPESFVIPAVNIIISGVLLLGILKFFSSSIVYHYRERYLELNDTENEVLAEYRKNDRRDYMHSVHTAYFCERIAARLSLDADALKCAGYYHKLWKIQPDLLAEQPFPPEVRNILTEYSDRSRPVERKETAVLMCADTVVNTVQYLLSKSRDRELNYDYIIDSVFKRFSDTKAFIQSDITLRELNTMQDIFKEEKLYYDFLR